MTGATRHIRHARHTISEEIGLLLVSAGTWLYSASPSLALSSDAIPSAKRAIQISAEMLPYSALVTLSLYAVTCMPNALLPSRTEVGCACVSALLSSSVLDERTLVTIGNGVALFVLVFALALAARVARGAPEKAAPQAAPPVNAVPLGAQSQPGSATPEPPALPIEPAVPSATSPPKRTCPTPLLPPIGRDKSFSPKQSAGLSLALPPSLGPLLEVSAIALHDAWPLAHASGTSSLSSQLYS
jgi:hypothetical protein